jgi:hypothetical protein
MLRKTGFLTFGLFMTASAAYVAGRIILEMEFGTNWAASILGVVFVTAVLILDRISIGPELELPVQIGRMPSGQQAAMLVARLQRRSPGRLPRKPRAWLDNSPITRRAREGLW